MIYKPRKLINFQIRGHSLHFSSSFRNRRYALKEIEKRKGKNPNTGQPNLAALDDHLITFFKIYRLQILKNIVFFKTISNCVYNEISHSFQARVSTIHLHPCSSQIIPLEKTQLSFSLIHSQLPVAGLLKNPKHNLLVPYKRQKQFYFFQIILEYCSA